MSSALDMSLDDLIVKSKQSSKAGSGGRGKGGSRRGGRGRAGFLAPRNTTSFRKGSGRGIAKPNRGTLTASWRSDADAGTKLYVSNLDYGVSNDDIRELFSEVGDLKLCSIHYDRSGRSKGTAEVVFVKKSEAVAAVKRYNNVQLDGKPMHIEMVGPTANVNNGSGVAKGRSVAPNSTRGRGGFRGGRFGKGRGSVKGKGRGGKRLPASEKKSVEDLDAELTTYHAQAMDVN